MRFRQESAAAEALEDSATGRPFGRRSRNRLEFVHFIVVVLVSARKVSPRPQQPGVA